MAQGTVGLYGGRCPGKCGRVPSGLAIALPNSWSPPNVVLPVETVSLPPPGWNRTYIPFPSKFWPSPASETIVYQNSL